MDIPDQKHIEYIERYLNNELPDQEKITFEADLQSNEVLREQVEWVRNLPNFLFSMEKERLSEQVQTWMEDKTPTEADQAPIQKTKPAQSHSFARTLKIVASLAAAVLLVFLAWHFLQPKPTPAQQVDQYIALHHADPLILRGNQSKEWQSAIQFYKAQDFENMIGSMKPLVSDPKVSLEQLFYNGLAHLYTSPPALDSTLYYFSLTSQRDDLAYKEEIDWYSSLVYIKQGELERARVLLNTLQSSDSKYKDQAKNLIQQLPE